MMNETWYSIFLHLSWIQNNYSSNESAGDSVVQSIMVVAWKIINIIYRFWSIRFSSQKHEFPVLFAILIRNVKLTEKSAVLFINQGQTIMRFVWITLLITSKTWEMVRKLTHRRIRGSKWNFDYNFARKRLWDNFGIGNCRKLSNFMFVYRNFKNPILSCSRNGYSSKNSDK